MNIGIIGAGISGLATAVRLAAKGHHVEVYEKNSIPGGKMSSLSMNGFRFDTGPSLFTLPQLFLDLAAIKGDNDNEFIPYQSLPVNCKYFFSDNSTFSFYQDRKKLENEVKEKTIDSPETIIKRLDKSRKVYETSAPVFIFNSFLKLSNFKKPEFRNMAPQLYKLDFFRTMHKANKRDFKDKKLIQIFDRYATYNGSNPYKAPATFNMIAHLENNIGAFFPKQGMYSLIEYLYRCACELGVTFYFDTSVNEVMVKDKKVKGIKTPQTYKEYDAIVSAVDINYFINHLYPSHPLKGILNKREKSSSALIFYWGINKTFPSLELHNILFSENYPQEFKHLFKLKDLYEDPTIYIFISSKVVQKDAPEGCENWFVMINAPADNGQDWEKLIAESRKNIISKINRLLNTDIEKHIICEEVSSPLTIMKKTNSMSGALYGGASNSFFSAFARHPNYFPTISGLFFAGGSVHPGGGIPLCLASAAIVEQEINEYNA